MSEYKKYSNSVSGHPMMEEKKDAMSGATANYKTSFRVQNGLADDKSQSSAVDGIVFAYPGTDKGVAGETAGEGNV